MSTNDNVSMSDKSIAFLENSLGRVHETGKWTKQSDSNCASCHPFPRVFLSAFRTIFDGKTVPSIILTSSGSLELEALKHSNNIEQKLLHRQSHRIRFLPLYWRTGSRGSANAAIF